MTIRQLLQRKPGIIDPFDAELLIAHVIDKPREFVITRPDFVIRRSENRKIKKLFKKRMCGVPLAYLTGHKEFFGLDFVVNKHVLVPRPETEILVTTALEHLSTEPLKNTMLIDVGTGSGCIPISIAKTIKQFNNLTISATDISRQALTVAKHNAQKHNVDITFLHGNLLEPIIKNSKFEIRNSKLIVTANLPYLTQEQFQNEPSIQHEPKSALVAKKGGLELYEKLLKQILQISKTYNLKPITYFEIDPSQTHEISKLIKTYLPNSTIEIQKDLAGHDRVVIIGL